MHFCSWEESSTYQDGTGSERFRSLTLYTLNTVVFIIFADILDDHGLTRLVEEQTKNNSILDLMRTNYPAMVFRVEILPGIADHDAVFTEVDTRPVISYPVPESSKVTLTKEGKLRCHAKGYQTNSVRRNG